MLGANYAVPTLWMGSLGKESRGLGESWTRGVDALFVLWLPRAAAYVRTGLGSARSTGWARRMWGCIPFPLSSVPWLFNEGLPELVGSLNKTSVIVNLQTKYHHHHHHQGPWSPVAGAPRDSQVAESRARRSYPP